MDTEKKIKILKRRDRKKFFEKIFCNWLFQKRINPKKLICFWCEEIIPIEDFIDAKNYFVVTKGGEIFERPTLGKNKFNNLYQETYRVELCSRCFYDLDMFNETGLLFTDIRNIY
jgi:hypothetical protein